MYKRRFLAGLIDRFCIILLFISFVLVYYGLFTSSGYLGRYQALAFGTTPSRYEYMKYSQYSSIEDSVDPYYVQQYNKAAKEQNITSYKELDNAMTTIFVGVNIVYFLFWGLIAKSTFGEMLCGLTTYDCNGTKSDMLSIIFRTMVLSLLLSGFVGFRYLIDSTYLKVSLLLLFVNWCLLFYNGRSLVDLLSFTKLQKITQ